MKKTYAKPDSDKELLVSDRRYDRNGEGAQAQAMNGEGKTPLEGRHKPSNGAFFEEPKSSARIPKNLELE